MLFHSIYKILSTKKGIVAKAYVTLPSTLRNEEPEILVYIQLAQYTDKGRSILILSI